MLKKYKRLFHLDITRAGKINFPSDDITNLDSKLFEYRDSLIFNNGKYQLLQLAKSNKLYSKSFKLFLLTSGMYNMYNAGYNLVFLHPLKTVFWGSLSLLALRIYYSINNNKTFIITALQLLEDCKTIEFSTSSKIHTADIKEIRKLKQSESIFFLKIMTADDYFPIIIKNQFYLIPKKIKVFNSELFKAITEGKYIDLKKGVKIDEKEVVDI